MNYVKIDKLLFIARRLYNVWRMVFCLDYGVFTIIWRFWLLEVRGLSTVWDRWCSIIRICRVFDAHQWSCLQYTNGMLSKNVLCNSRIPGIYTTTINLLYITSYTYIIRLIRMSKTKEILSERIYFSFRPGIQMTPVSQNVWHC